MHRLNPFSFKLRIAYLSSPQIAKAEKRLNFAPYGVHHFLVPSAGMSHRSSRQQTDYYHFEPLLVLSLTIGTFMMVA
jgi:hypothetical protein